MTEIDVIWLLSLLWLVNDVLHGAPVIVLAGTAGVAAVLWVVAVIFPR